MAMWSHSRIETFKTCPKKYELAYVRKVPRTARGIEAYMGSRVHEALESLYEDVCMGRVPEVGEVLDRYREAWDREWDPCVRVVREGYTPADYRAAGERAIRGYYERHHPFDADTTIGIERRVVLDLDAEGERRLQGYVDRIVKVADGVWEIHDYKTGRSLPTQADVDSDRQLALYQLAVEQMYPEVREMTLVWHYLMHGEELHSKRRPEQLAALREEVLADVREIECADDFPTRVSRLCDWCDYRSACPAWSHEALVETAADEDVSADEDVALVERYVALSDSVRETEREKDAVRAEILRRLDERGLEALSGLEHRVRLSETSRARVPKTGTAEREELERTLKEGGVWGRFSVVSAKDLSAALADGSLPEDVRHEVGRYVTIETVRALRCSRR